MVRAANAEVMRFPLNVTASKSLPGRQQQV